ncbi:hypothetical protein ACVW1C_001882 [Bradyrhizobium sp. USDA 4011]
MSRTAAESNLVHELRRCQSELDHLKDENTILTAENERLKADLEAARSALAHGGLDAVGASIDRLAGRGTTWMPFAAMARRVPSEIAARSTMLRWCENFLEGRTGLGLIIVTSRQAGINARIEVDVESFWDGVEIQAYRRRIPFTRPPT